jgi:hypothetical protein
MLHNIFNPDLWATYIILQKENRDSTDYLTLQYHSNQLWLKNNFFIGTSSDEWTWVCAAMILYDRTNPWVFQFHHRLPYFIKHSQLLVLRRTSQHKTESQSLVQVMLQK